MAENTSDKTLYDGRLLTHQRLSNAWIMYANSLSIQDYELVLTSMQVILVESAGALTEESLNKYIERLDVLTTKITLIGNGSKINQNNLNKNSIKKDLFKWCIDIKKETKYLYLPYEAMENNPDELFEKIKKQSG